MEDIYTPEDPNEEAKTIIRLACKEYNENNNQTHAFFSTYNPDYILTELTNTLQ